MINKYPKLKHLREKRTDIKRSSSFEERSVKFLRQVNKKEQPFGNIYDFVLDARRHRGINIDLQSKVDILQVRNRLLTTVLIVRCDYTVLLTFLNN